MKWTSVLLTLLLSAVVKSHYHKKYRLSGDVKPTFYSITIQPDLDNETFLGEISMHIRIHSSVKSIELHSSNLNITSLYLDTEEVVFNPCSCTDFNFGFVYADFELVRIFRRYNQPIPPGSHVLYFNYSGKFSQKTEGMFKTGFTKNGTTLSYLVATDFQPTHARKVFPSFDEPGFKTRYQLDLVVPNSSYVALSNMRVMNTYDTPNGIVYKFETTPPMSIYLLSFVITQHTATEYIADSIPYRVYSYKKQNGTKLLEFASEVIRFYTNFTDYNYTLPKIDFVEFDRKETTATENWGLVTFKTSLLCSEDDVYDISQKESVVAHELAHFWFGDLVTNVWWDDIWLQESLATFMEIKAEEAILHNSASNDFYYTYLENLFWLEVYNISSPVVHFEEDPIKIRENFNDITYIKGATILRMTEMVIGPEKMRDVIRQYIKKYAFRTATTSDLLAIVSTVAKDGNVREFMETFLYQSRFPVISVEERGDDYVLKQETCISKVHSPQSQFRFKWTIPVTYITNLNGTPTLAWFHKSVDEVIIPKQNATWIKLNHQQIGYYRANYSDELWTALMTHNEELDVSERNYLLWESVGLFDLDLQSCDVILKYFWELSFSSPEYVITVYWKLSERIKGYDDEAAQKLKDFFYHVLLKTGKKHMAESFSKKPIGPLNLGEDGSSEDKDEPSKQIQSCIRWLRTESAKYYNTSSEAVPE